DASVARQVAHGRERRRRLPAAGLPDETVGLSRPDRERESAQHLTVPAANAVGDVEVGQLEAGDDRVHRSSTFEMPSAIGLTETTSDAIASAGKSTVHQ